MDRPLKSHYIADPANLSLLETRRSFTAFAETASLPNDVVHKSMLKKYGLIEFALAVGFASINRAAADYSIDSSFGIGLWGAPEATGSFGPDYAGGAPPVAASREYSIGGFVGVIRGRGASPRLTEISE